jgi:hypothetical protein
MKRLPVIAWLVAVAALLSPLRAEAQNRATYEQTVAVHAKANQVPEALVHRVIVRESKYQPNLIGRGGTIGLMQIKLATARGLGYKGDAEGLRDPETNLTYGVKYLAGAYRAAESYHDRAVHLYASGYYEVAKRQRLKHPGPLLASAPPSDAAAEPNEAAVAPVEVAKSEEAATPDAVKPNATAPMHVSRRKTVSAAKTASKPIDLIPGFLKPKAASKPAAKKLADAKERVPRPSAGMPASTSGGANAPKPR